MKHYNLKIKGKVQGVWYRKSTMEEAIRLGLTGFVQNESDGSVYAEAEGPQEILDELVNWCKRGPILANVTEVIAEEGPVCDFKGFEVRR